MKNQDVAWVADILNNYINNHKKNHYNNIKFNNI